MADPRAEQLGGLDVAVDAITVGVRHRKDLGDLDALAASIERLGLLQPITITPGRVLVCGWRRLEAAKRLGWTQVRTWVRSGLSDGATRLLAEYDENVLRQAYTRTEQATLYRELKEVLRQEAQRRQQASRFGSVPDGAQVTSSGGATSGDSGDSDIVGAVDSTPPADPHKQGRVRDQAALLATGKKSWQAMERIGTLMDLATDIAQPEEIRDLAAEAVARIEDGGQVAPEWAKVQATLRASDGAAVPGAGTVQTVVEPEAADAIRPAVAERAGITLYALRTWGTTWDGIARLLDQHDPAVLGPALRPRDWDTICHVQVRLTTLVERMRDARDRAGASNLLDHATAEEEKGQGDQRAQVPGPGDMEAASGPTDGGEPDEAPGRAAVPLARVIAIGARS
ncbi:ParB N-terminal domain-containing protein [Antribacter sp. KLBMP9083]|uniref:ParB N-terminal domain-containing protein n=1 Tax=Antribacter soli TaxID=2910976 RepID=A0AA41QHT0_9MICO|nr:ParB N-terminal domain-containing protein [Antribacter soli]MCF4123700.1 ParB N-terminal domain-containing protein [Antribacter soli]